MLFLARRDRWASVFCRKPTEIETVTVEHFVPITAGGNSHLANLSLAHEMGYPGRPVCGGFLATAA